MKGQLSNDTANIKCKVLSC